MNDLDLIAGLDDTRDPDPAVLERGLHRLQAGIAAEAVGAAEVVPASRTSGRRLGPGRRAAFAAVAAAAAAVLVVAAVRDGRPDNRGVAGGRPGASATSSGSTGGQPTPTDLAPTGPSQVLPTPGGETQAAAFMRRVAMVAEVAPPVAPRPDQFLYVSNSAGYEAWLSIDGTRDGEVRNALGDRRVPGCVDGIAQVEGNAPAPRPLPCVPTPVFLPDAPTDPQAMADYLIAAADPPTEQGPVPQPTPNQLGKRLLSLLQFTWLLPAAQAALFEALPLLPGLELTVDPVPGQPITALSWTFSGASNSLLFDTNSLRYLGFLSTPPNGAGPVVTGGPTGPLVSQAPTGTPAVPPSGAPSATVMTQRIVDQVGDRT